MMSNNRCSPTLDILVIFLILYAFLTLPKFNHFSQVVVMDS